MKCRCGSRVPCGEATYVGAQVLDGFLYAIWFQCPACKTSLLATLWESDEQERLIDDVEPTMSSARDTREDDAA